MINPSDMLLEHFKAIEKVVIKLSKSQKRGLREVLLATCSLSLSSSRLLPFHPSVSVSLCLEDF